MCKKCLEQEILRFEADILLIKETSQDEYCECCIEYRDLLISSCEDLKILALTKIKLMAQICPQKTQIISKFQGTVKNRITENFTLFLQLFLHLFLCHICLIHTGHKKMHIHRNTHSHNET